jgi:hypothetical protein
MTGSKRSRNNPEVDYPVFTTHSVEFKKIDDDTVYSLLYLVDYLLRVFSFNITGIFTPS